MSKVIPFPGSRYSPPKGTVDALIDELTTVEIELARARLGQSRSETRQANVLFAWYCLKRAVFWGLVLWLLATLMAPAKADSVNRSFYNERGSFAGGRAAIVWNGQSWTRVIYHGYMGNTTSFSDGRGRFFGSAIQRGKWTSFYDGRGRYTGSSITTSPRR
jgi:hypothetical protein